MVVKFSCDTIFLKLIARIYMKYFVFMYLHAYVIAITVSEEGYEKSNELQYVRILLAWIEICKKYEIL